MEDPGPTSEIQPGQDYAANALSHLRRDVPQERAVAGQNAYLIALEEKARLEALRAEEDKVAAEEAAQAQADAEAWRLRGGLYMIAGVFAVIATGLIVRRLFLRPAGPAVAMPTLVDVGNADAAFVASALQNNALQQTLSMLAAK